MNGCEWKKLRSAEFGMRSEGLRGGRITRLRLEQGLAGMTTSNQPGRIACPHCQAMIKAPSLATGSQVNCPKCGQGFRLGQEPGAGGQGSGGAEVQGARPKAQGRESGVGGRGSDSVQGP